MAVYLGANKVNILGGQPVVVEGIDTSNATATANDIAKDLIAYGNGVEIKGNIDVSGGVGKIYMSNGTTDTPKSLSYNESAKTISTNIDFPNRVIMEAGSKAEATYDCKFFGDATASDVAEDKTFTSTSGLKVTGKLPVKTSNYYEDILYHGSLENKYACCFQPNTDILIRKNTYIGIYVPFSDFGDAKPEEVLEGKTFTSSSGRMARGTYVPTPSGYQSGEAVKAYESTNVTISSTGSSAKTNYSSSLTISNGVISLNNSTSLTVSSTSNLDVIKGKYAQAATSYGTSTNPIYYIPEDATFTQSGSTYSKYFTVSKANQMFVLA